MSKRVLASLGVVAFATSVAALALVPAAAQTSKPTAAKATTKAWTPSSRTPDGQPDLEGTYVVAPKTPLERPQQYAGKEFLTDEEVAAIEKRARENVGKDTGPPEEGDTGYYNQFWIDPGTSKIGSRRTSLIVDPPDGKLPPLTPAAEKMRDQINALLKGDGMLVFNRIGPQRLKRANSGLADSYLDRDSIERCIARSMPKLGGPYNNGVEIFQGPGHVLIHYETNDTRVIPLDNRPHVSQNIREWLGDSRGRWEGKTLVVDTTNFTDDQGYLQGFPQGKLHLVERFTRTDANAIKYEATFDDPATFTKPWTVTFDWVREDSYQVYEYACHEGNDSLTGILSGAREEEKAAAGAAKKGSR